MIDHGTVSKSGDYYRANGYAIGEYKKRPNMIGTYRTVKPDDVEQEINLLMDWYDHQDVNAFALAEFHARYESIHPFQDELAGYHKAVKIENITDADMIFDFKGVNQSFFQT